ncbi:cell division protein SepF [Micromonospora sp. CPCC 205558]|uniref:cell division protein SepF n=1 Tax=Micromonospora sp. CPCC 205558 TaxID=3122403 RepID=UPI002FF41960
MPSLGSVLDQVLSFYPNDREFGTMTEWSLVSIAFSALAALVIAAYRLGARPMAIQGRDADLGRVCRRDHASELERSLESAVRENSYRVDRDTAPGVRLEAALRVKPTDFAVGAAEVAEILQAGRVASIDLSYMEQYEAARLVNYCHGLTVMANGWIFRLAQNVIVITPGS